VTESGSVVLRGAGSNPVLQAGREATFNSPNVVNNAYRKYDFDFDPVALSRAAGRAHTFGRPPRRLSRKPQWDWVLSHCDEPDAWLDQIRVAMVGLPRETKWLVHGYERCGAADVKRPMKEMLREGLNHHDRIPHATKSPPLSAWVRHIIYHYSKLPEMVFLAPASVPPSSNVFRSEVISQAVRGSKSDFGIWGSHVIEMPENMRTAYCSKMWQYAAKSRKRGCPERIVSMADAVFMVSRERIHSISPETWKSILKLVDEPAEAENEQMLLYSWHLLLGQPAVMAHRTLSKH